MRIAGRAGAVATGLLAMLAVAAGLVLAAPARAQTGNPANDALMARAPNELRLEFRNILRRAGASCAEVSVLYPAGQDPARTAYWDVTCRDGGPWRVALRAERFSTPTLRNCGNGPDPAEGPCFRPLPPPMPQYVALPPSGVPAQCRAACQSQPQALQNACLQRCAAGGNVQQASLPSGGAARGRFGFIYVGEPPATAFGFDAGGTDRLAASMAALRACESIIGRNQCRLALDFPNACGALAQALTLPPVQVRRLSTGVGQSREQAEAEAMRQCRLAEAPGSSITCRIAASGC